MTDFPRLAVVGAGVLSTRRIYPYLGAAGAELVGVCDLDLARAERNARLFGGRAYRDLEAMLDAEAPDAVIVCVGPEAHPELACRVLRRGLPVYTEKPPAITAAEAREVALLARETGLLCVTAFKKRYARCYQRAVEFLAEFPETERNSLSLDYAAAEYDNSSPRRQFLLDFAIHGIDLTGWLWGYPTEVVALAKGTDAYAVAARYANGSVASLNLTCGRSFGIPTEEVELTLRGGNFMTIHNSSSWRLTRAGQCVEWREPPTFTSAGDDGRDTGHLAELEDFVTAVREGRTTSRSAIDQSYRSMVLYEAIRDSAVRGEMIRPDYSLG